MYRRHQTPLELVCRYQGYFPTPPDAAVHSPKPGARRPDSPKHGQARPDACRHAQTPKHTDLTAIFEDADDVRTRFFFKRSYTSCYPLAALPAISLPGGFTADNLPIGLQLGARPFAEETLLRAGHAYEQATTWHQRLAPEAQR